MNRQWFMLDLEFTSLNPFVAYITEFGLVHFDPRTFEAIDKIEAHHPVLEHQWDPKTLEWATTTYGEQGITKYVITPDMHFSYAAYQRNRHSFLLSLKDILQQKVEEFGKEEVFIIVNHPEVDITILKHQFHQYSIDWPLHYQNIKDMDSLMMAAMSIWGPEAYDDMWKHIKEQGFTKETLTHTAVEDCLSQINLLKSFGVDLPQ